MTTVNHRQMKRYQIESQLNYPVKKKIKQEFITNDWSLQTTTRKKLKKINDNQEFEQEYFCQVYLKFYPSTLKCSLDVLVQTNNKFDYQNNSILIGKTRIGKVIKAGVIRIRLVSSLFCADTDVHEDPSLIKFETIKYSSTINNHFDKQFALLLKKNEIGPGPIGKLFVECLDPSNGLYTSNSPIFELNLNLESEHKILLTSSYKTIDNELDDKSLECGCTLSSHLTISDKCNLTLQNLKLVHRLSEPLRCFWKSIGRELFPCFSEDDLIDLNQRYFLSDGNYECTYQLLRAWVHRQPQQANIRYLLTRLKLPFHLIELIHNDILKPFLSS